jgi:hypothetical protein
MEVMQGSDFTVSLIFTNSSNSSINLSGSVSRAMVKRRVNDADVDALVDINSVSSPSAFDTSSGSGRLYVTIAGNLTTDIEVDEKLTVHTQVLTKVDTSYYRSSNIPVVLIESAIKSDI